MKPLFLLIAVLSLPTWAQNCAQIDEKLTIHYQKMQNAGSYSDHFDDEVLERETKLFTETLQFLKVPESWQCDFSKVQEAGVRVEMSEDKQLRIFSWDWQTGGTMHDFGSMWQYRQLKGKTKTKFQESSNWVESVHQTSLNQQTYYWVMGRSIGDNHNHMLTVELYQILDQGLQPAKLIKTSKFTNEISFVYDPSTVREQQEQVNFFYDEKSEKLRFPVVIEKDASSSGTPTNKWIQYRFNGQYFVREKN